MIEFWIINGTSSNPRRRLGLNRDVVCEAYPTRPGNTEKLVFTFDQIKQYPNMWA